MYKLSCDAMGMDCDFMAKGSTKDEVKSKMMKMIEKDMGKMSEMKKSKMMTKMDKKIEML